MNREALIQALKAIQPEVEARGVTHLALFGNAERLLANRSYEDLQADRISRAADERFLEIVSEGSRHIPATLKSSYPDPP